MPRRVDPTSIAAQARALGLSPQRVYQRLHLGWTLAEALDGPRSHHRRPMQRFADAVAAYLTCQAERDLAWSAAVLLGAALTTLEVDV